MTHPSVRPDPLLRLCVLVAAATFTFFSLRARFQVPYGDDWDWLFALLTRPTTLKSLFEPHNEHMIPLPRILLGIQYWLQGSNGHLVCDVAVAVQLSFAWLVWREIRRRWATEWTGLAVIAVVSGLLFSTFQLQSVVFLAAALFPLVQFFAALAIICILNATEQDSRPAVWLAACALATAGAALTTTNGLVVPALVALLAWTRGARRSIVLAFSAATIVGLVGYVVLVGSPWTNPPPPAGNTWGTPSLPMMAAFFLTFFGTALAYANVPLATCVGASAFAFGCYTGWRLLRDGSGAPRIEHFAVGLMAFATLSALMATPARAQFGAIQAAQSRYATYAFAYWTAMALWIVNRLSVEPAWQRMRRPISFVALAVSALILVANLFVGNVWTAKADNIAAAGMAMTAGVEDDEWVATLHPITSIVYATATQLRAAGDPDMTNGRVGQRMRSSFDVPSCAGKAWMIPVSEDGGWRVRANVIPTSGTAVIVDRSEYVRGEVRPAPLVGAPNPTDPAVVSAVWRAWLRRTAPSPEWLGFSQPGDGPPYTFYRLVDDVVSCRVTAVLRPST